MTADQVFHAANLVALIGWLVLAAGVVLKRVFWRDVVAGQIWPLALSLAYLCLMVFFWAKTEGGFDSLANVQRLFTYHWAAMAGWAHYLAFDLFVGAHIAKRVMDEGLPRLALIVLLPLTFMFGPIGFVGFYLTQLLFRKVSAQS